MVPRFECFFPCFLLFSPSSTSSASSTSASASDFSFRKAEPAPGELGSGAALSGGARIAPPSSETARTTQAATSGRAHARSGCRPLVGHHSQMTGARCGLSAGRQVCGEPRTCMATAPGTLPASNWHALEHALQLEQRFLHLQAAGVAAEAAVAAQHPVAGDDERDRVGASRPVPAARTARSLPAPRPARCSCGSARRGSRAIARWTRPRKPWLSCQSMRQVELLAACRRSRGRARGAPRRAARVPRARAVRSARPVPRASRRRPRPAGRGAPGRAVCGEQQRAEGRVGGRVGDVEQALGGGPLGRLGFRCGVLLMPSPFAVV